MKKYLSREKKIKTGDQVKRKVTHHGDEPQFSIAWATRSAVISMLPRPKKTAQQRKMLPVAAQTKYAAAQLKMKPKITHNIALPPKS
jgi:hypothetical protein